VLELPSATVPGPLTVTRMLSDIPTAPARVVLVSDALFSIGWITPTIAGEAAVPAETTSVESASLTGCAKVLAVVGEAFVAAFSHNFDFEATAVRLGAVVVKVN